MEKGKIINIPVEIVNKRLFSKGWLYTVKRQDGQFKHYYEDKLQQMCQRESMWSKIRKWLK